MAASTAPTAKGAILTLVIARPLLAANTTDGVKVTWGAPTESEDAPKSGEHIYLGDIGDVDQDWAALGRSPVRREERYVIPVFVTVWRYGDDERSTEERAWALADEVEAAMASDPTLGGAISRGWAGFRLAAQENGPLGPQRWGTRVRCEVRVETRLA